MRVSTNQFYDNSIRAITSQQSALLQVSQQLSAQRKLLSPSDDPVAAGREVALDATLKANEQMLKNQADAKGLLEGTENYLVEAGGTLQLALTRVVQAGGGGLNEENRQSILADLKELRDQLMSVANTQDENGNYIFAGYKRDSQPFVRNASGVVYQGDAGVRQSQIGPNRVIDVSFSGNYLFGDIPTGRNGLDVGAGSGNTGSATLTASTVTDCQAWSAAAAYGPYTIEFGADGAYTVSDKDGAEVGTGTLGEDGQAIDIAGVQIGISGRPAEGDTLSFGPSRSQSVFDTLDQAIAALSQPASATESVSRANALYEVNLNLNSAMNRLLEARSSIGSRLTEIEAATTAGETRGDQITGEISRVVGSDLETMTELTGELAKRTYTVQAAQQTYTQIARMSIFNFL
ncbi:flagellar hook-associated protein FlgL [Pigmentiphaga sp. GD03639]|uniref:flagellar hook-associated protein FlgL n=1 Tax=Pigmentiphaga sp. GD03639 TaxID=2975354 RepID=UPI002446E153|nr:flagellar hook-associated protein FlgL [Pigmentiphaga sp. GD03639]MDH2238923.1 flagellar hook-associated protein FlgL [Pigmentiphaga sp. GD03639]